ncbi:MAG: glycosyltransferase [Parvularculaceae bacterium]|nr:glycosyltransferase [Parvularculaceae bacterium]
MGRKVALAMPVYNGERYVGGAIKSALAQDYSDIELIITDNASTDATEEICEDAAAKDARVRYVRNPRNLGAAPNYNRGFELADGEYLKWCAHDDLLSPNFVSSCVAALERVPDASLAFPRTICIDPDDRPIDGPDQDETPALLDQRPERRFYRAITLGGTCFPIFGVFRTAHLRRSTLHRSYYGSDRALIAEAALLGKLLRVDDAVFYNREHPTRSIRMVDHAERSRWQDTTRASPRAAMEHVNLFRHLMEIAGRHGDVVAPSAARAAVLRYGLAPQQAARMALDVVRYVSPSGAARMKALFTGERRSAA